ncbi:MAG: flagellar basal-body MS-ring/collar protein FliF, partial [Edwardsiella piscicida]
GELPFWQKQSFIDLLTTLGRYLLVALVAWLLWRKLVKPMLTKQQRAAAAAQQRVDAPPLSVQPAKQPSNEELQQRRKLQQRSTAEAQTERVREMAEQDPRVVALVIRQWMSTEQQ